MKKYRQRFNEAKINRSQIDFDTIGGGVSVYITQDRIKGKVTVDVGHYSGGRHNDIIINADKYKYFDKEYNQDRYDIQPLYDKIIKVLLPIANKYEKEILDALKKFK